MKVSRSILTLLLVLGGALGGASSQPLETPQNLATDPEAQGHADLFFAQALVRFAGKDYAAALPLFEKAAATWSKDGTYAYFSAICKLRLGRIDEAIVALTAALPPAPNRVPPARIHSDLGEAYYRKADFEKAEEEFRTSVQLDDKEAWSRFYLGLALYARGDTVGALAEFERAQALDPSLASDEAYKAGMEARRRGDTTGARGEFEKVLEAKSPEVAAGDHLHRIEPLEPPLYAPPPPRTEFRVSAWFERDDNPGRLNDTLSSFLPGLDSDDRGALQFRAGFQPLIDRGGWTVGLVVHGVSARHAELEALDLDGAQGVFQATWGTDPLGYVNGPLGYARVAPGESRFGFILQGGSTYFDLGGDSFRRDHEASLSFLVRQRGFGKTQADLQYDDRTFFNPFFRVLTGRVATVRLGQYFILGGKPDRYLRVAAARSATTAEIEALEFDTTQILAEIALPLSRRWNLFLHGSLSKDDYDPASALLFGEEREDRRRELVGTGVVRFSSHTYATLRYSWVRQEVDPDSSLLSYDRGIASVGITWFW